LFVHLRQVGVAGRRLEGVEERRHDTSEYENGPERSVVLVGEQTCDGNDEHADASSSESDDSHRSSTNFVNQERIQNYGNKTDDGDDERDEEGILVT
jgi:hypothetical protein